MQKKTRIMQTTRSTLLVVLSFSITFATGTAQATNKAPGGQQVTTLIDRAEVRVLKIALEPGTAIPKQAHSDVKFSLFLPITSGIELTTGSEQPVLTEAGHALFILPDMSYSMRNPGVTAASAFEVLVNNSAASSSQRSALAQAGSLVHASFVYAQVPDRTPARAPDVAAPVDSGAVRGGAGSGGLITTEIDRAEVRVLRNQVAPGQVHAMHSHDDVVFHLLMAITPGIEVTVGSEKPVMLEPGQIVFLPRATQHSFRNAGTTTPAVAYEVFVNDGPSADAIEGGWNAHRDVIPEALLHVLDRHDALLPLTASRGVNRSAAGLR